jgi:rubrerythrin
MRWTLDDIDWDAFDASRVDPDLLRAVKAASLVEFNAPDYVTYLCNVFVDKPALKADIEQWGREEEQHGRALSKWAKLADPSFDFEESFARFRKLQNIDTNAIESVRGSRAGEMVARCVVETGTSSFYTAIKDATAEPCLRQIVTYMAADEFAHYRLFYETFRQLDVEEPISPASRLRVAISRVSETEDDELAGAYYCANFEPDSDVKYDMRRFANEYFRAAMGVYGEHHVGRVVSMVLKAGGLSPHGWLADRACGGVWWFWSRKLERLRAYA